MQDNGQNPVSVIERGISQLQIQREVQLRANRNLRDFSQAATRFFGIFGFVNSLENQAFKFFKK